MTLKLQSALEDYAKNVLVAWIGDHPPETEAKLEQVASILPERDAIKMAALEFLKAEAHRQGLVETKSEDHLDAFKKSVVDAHRMASLWFNFPLEGDHKPNPEAPLPPHPASQR